MFALLVFMSFLAVGVGAKSNSTILPSPMVTTISMGSNMTTSLIVTSVSASLSSAATNHSASINTSTVVSSTVMASSSVTTPKPTPKPTSKPTPKPTPVDYSVKSNGTYCLLAKLRVSFNITYNQSKVEKMGNKTMGTTFALLDLPFKNFTINESVCGSDVSSLVISWPMPNPQYHFKMSFKSTNVSWEVTELSLNASTKNSPFENATEPMIRLKATNKSELELLSGKPKGSYFCSIQKRIQFAENGEVLLEYTKLQPFDVPREKNEVFGEEKNCQGSPKPKKPEDNNIVPIAVGCALAGLVLIVLIAYIIGRRKSQRGYEKV